MAMRPRTFALAVVAATAAAVVAIALLRLKGPVWRRPCSGAAPEPYRCDCGQAFRVAGSGRHRVYWIADAPQGDPLMADRCPACDRPLPRELARRAEAAPAVT
jgi:hypothetical protein